MASFAKDVVTNIPVPEGTQLTKDFVAEGVSDLLKTGFAVNEKVQKGIANKTKLDAERETAKFVDRTVAQYISNLDQGMSVKKARIGVQRSISSFASPLLRDEAGKQIASRLSAMERGVQLEEKPVVHVDAFSGASTEIQMQARANTNTKIDPAIGTPGRDAINIEVNRIVLANMELAAATAEANGPDASAESLSKFGISMSKMIGINSKSVLIEMTETIEDSANLESGERLAVLNGTKTNIATYKGILKNGVDTAASGFDPVKAKPFVDSLHKEIDRAFESVENAHEDAMGVAASNLAFIANDVGLGLLKAGNILKQVETAYGRPLPELTWAFIQAQGGHIGLEGQIEGALGLTAEQKKAFNLQTLHEYVNGGGSIEEVGESILEPEDRNRLGVDGFKFYEAMTKNGKLLELSDKKDRNRSADAMVHILGDVNSKDPDTVNTVMNWINDPNFQEMLKVIDPDKAAAIQNMIIGTAKNSLRNGGGVLSEINKHPGMYVFDVNKGEFSMSAQGKLQREVRVGASTLISKQEMRKVIKQANRDVSSFNKSRVANPALNEMQPEVANNWLLNMGAGNVVLSEEVATKGRFFTPSEDEVEAVEGGMSLADLEKMKKEVDRIASLPNQVLELQKELRDMRRSGKTSRPEDTSDMDDEQFEEWIKLQREARKK